MEMDLPKLQDRAKKLQAQLEAGPRVQPLFIEFSGSAKSGKSSCIDIVAHFFRRTGFNVLAPTEGASKRTPYYLKNDGFAFNIWSATYALNHVLEGLYHSDQYHLAILDRGVFDALLWFDLMANNGTISDDTCSKIHQFIMLDEWRSSIDAVFLFTADPVTSMEREQREKLIDAPGRMMNPKSLQELNDAATRVREKYASEFRNVYEVDTSNSANTTPQSTAYEVADRIIKLFESR